MHVVAERTAVLGLHWQVNVVRPEGLFGALFAEPVVGSGVIPRAAAVHAGARGAGLLVAYTRFTIPEGGGQFVANTPVMRQIADSPRMRPETAGCQLVPELAAQHGDLVADNQKLSGLAGNDLPDRLRQRGIDTLVLTGVATNLTVEQTARHGTDLGFTIYVLADCCTAVSPEVHDASLANLSLTTEGVVDSAEFLAALT